VVLNTDRFVVGSSWTLDILVDTPDPLTVKVPVPVLPDALVLADGPYIRETPVAVLTLAGLLAEVRSHPAESHPN